MQRFLRSGRRIRRALVRFRTGDRVERHRTGPVREGQPLSEAVGDTTGTASGLRARMTPTILVTGRDGQLGFELRRTLAPLGRVVPIDVATLDLCDLAAVRAFVRELR